jgi:predicted aspartyl protease
MWSRAVATAFGALFGLWAIACDPSASTTPEPAAAGQTTGGAPSAEDRTSQPTVELPLKQLSSNHIVVPFAIGAREPMAFILDTGASTSVISRETQRVLGYRDEDGTPVKGQGANGELNDVRLFSVPDARVGDRVYRDLSVAVMDLRHLQDKLDEPVAGILGRNFLARHDLEIDFVGRKLLLHGSDGVETGNVDVSAMAASEYGNMVGGLIGIEVSIDGGEAFPAVLDLGAARSVMNWHAARAVGLSRNSKALADSPEALLGADNTPIETKFITFETIAVGAAKIAKPTVYIADLVVFQTLGVADGPAMVFGVDMLVQRSIVIDYQSQQVYISRGGV